MRWPWQRREVRSSYTEQRVGAMDAAAIGATSGDPAAVGALECAAGLWSRVMASVAVSGLSGAFEEAVSPEFLGTVGRSLIRHGESLHTIEMSAGRVRLDAIGHWDVRGRSGNPDSWRFRVYLPAPDSQSVKTVRAAGVVFCKWETDPSAPWRGLSPLGQARSLASMAAVGEERLSHELSTPAAHVLPLPRRPTEEELVDLRFIKDLRGGLGAVESTAASWGGPGAAPHGDWLFRRVGADPPATLATLHGQAARAIWCACGIPPALFGDGSGATAARESWRLYIFSAVAPVVRSVERELRRKLDSPGLTLDLSPLAASDTQARARSLKSMVEAGMSLEDARRLSGLE